MNFEFTKEEVAFRKEVEDFVQAELPDNWEEKAIYWPAGYGAITSEEEEYKDVYDNLFLKLGKKGWLSIPWPKQYGGMGSWMKQAIFDDVMTYYKMPTFEVAVTIASHTIVSVGSEEMKKEWLPKIAKGEVRFWLGYSEPNAGSDLAAIKTKAIEAGNDLIVTGQKIWSTGAHISDYCWMLARTDQNSKYGGATLMIVDNDSPGITIRPIVNILGIPSFNEVFFDEVRVPKKNVVGEINKGFYYVMLALQHERLILGMGAFRRALDELIKYVKETHYDGETLSNNAIVKQKIANLAIEVEILSGFYWRTAWLMDNGKSPEIESSVLKLFGTELSQRLARVGMEILGLYGTLSRDSKRAPLRGWFGIGYLDSISGTLGAGTTEIQKGIIATRGLGLPRM